MYARNVVALPFVGRPLQSSSARRSAAIGRPDSMSSSASSARWRGPPSGTCLITTNSLDRPEQPKLDQAVIGPPHTPINTPVACRQEGRG